MTYLGVHLKAGEQWRFEPPQGHTVAWAAIGEGSLSAPAALRTGELVVFDRSGADISFTALEDTLFVLGSAVPHPHEMYLGSYSVHTSNEALKTGERGIRERAQVLRERGRL